MTKWCLLLVITSVLKNVHQFPSDDKGIYRDSAIEKIVHETSFDSCNNIMGQIINKMEYKEDIYRFLLEIGTSVNNWIFKEGNSGSSHWCKTKSEESPLVQLSWNSRQNHCVKLEVINDNGSPNFTEYICDLNTNFFDLRRGFTDLNFNSTIIASSAKTKRSLTRKVIQSYVNLAKEIETTECSSPTLNVYFNDQLVFSNASGVIDNDVPTDSLDVYINVDISSFHNSIPGKTGPGYLINTNPMDMYSAISDCSNQGKILLDIESKQETDGVVAAMAKYQIPNYWSSGHRLGSNYYHWHASGANFVYTNWNSGEPSGNDAGDYCIMINKQGFWNDGVCSSQLPFICEGTVVTEPVEIPPTVNILVDGKLAYELLSTQEYKDQSNVIEVKIGLNGDVVDDHTTKFSLLQKNSPKEEALEQRMITPENFIDSGFNGIDIRVENIKQKGLICQREKFYYVHDDEKLNYIDAMKFCQNRSSQLLSIQNEMQQLDIENVILNTNIDNYYWTSGHLAADGATWLWNGNEAITYSNWATGEPNNRKGNEKCIELFVPWKTAKWNDQDCQDKNRIICESFTEPYWRLEND